MSDADDRTLPPLSPLWSIRGALSVLLCALHAAVSLLPRAQAPTKVDAAAAAPRDAWLARRGVPASTVQRAVQARVNCVARNGTWRYEPDDEVIVYHSRMSDSRFKIAFCPDIEIPWLYEEDPAFFWGWGGHGTACGGARVRPFSRSVFCAALGGRDVLLVGDSMQGALHDALLGALEGSLPAKPECRRYECGGHRICHEEAYFTEHLPLGDPRKVLPATLAFAPNFNLTLLREGEVFAGSDYVHTVQPWLHRVTNHTLLIMNRGAHWAPTATLLAELADTFAAVRARAPAATVVWRNTPVGHMNVTHYFRALPLGERLVEASPPQWHWRDVLAQNAAVEALVADAARAQSAAGGGAWVFVDVETQTALRADHHTDPLHYCTPGPVDHWVHLLQTALTAAKDLGLAAT